MKPSLSTENQLVVRTFVVYPKSYSSFKSLGLMMGYLGFKEDPAYILPRISSERVSWLNEEIVNVCRDLVEKLITHIW